MTKNDEEWKPSAALPRKPTAEDQERVDAIAAPELCAPGDRKILWVQRLEAATVNASFGAHERMLEVLHPSYEDLVQRADSIAWARLAVNPREAGYRDAPAPSLRMKTVMTRAHERLAERQERADAEGLRLVVHGEDVAIVAHKCDRWAVGLESGDLLGHWRGEAPRLMTRIPPGLWALLLLFFGLYVFSLINYRFDYNLDYILLGGLGTTILISAVALIRRGFWSAPH